MLLAGPSGIGKSAFAHEVAARLLCEQPAPAAACGTCPSCHWLAGSNHPDFRHVRPEADVEAEARAVAGADTDIVSGAEKKKASRQIRIEQIRQLEDFVFVGSHRGGARVLLLEPADAMNSAAQNALLKILEEPSLNVYFLLVTSKIKVLLPTILSRCRVLKLPKPAAKQASEWLAMNGEGKAAGLLPMLGGAPLRALLESQSGRGAALQAVLASLAESGEDAPGLAARWESQLQLKDEAALSMESVVDIVQKWVVELARHKLAGRGQNLGERPGAVENLAGRATAAGLIRCYNDLVKMRALALHPLNSRLYLEELAERYLRAVSGGKGARG